jgi:hypothetical protein
MKASLFSGQFSPHNKKSLYPNLSLMLYLFDIVPLKVVSSEKVGGTGVTSTLGTWYGAVVMGVLISFNEAAILYRDFNSAPS